MILQQYAKKPMATPLTIMETQKIQKQINFFQRIKQKIGTNTQTQIKGE